MKFFKYLYSLFFIVIGLIELKTGKISIKGIVIDYIPVVYFISIFFIILGVYIFYLTYNDKKIEI